MHDTEKVKAWIDRNTECMIRFLQDIIRIPSVTGNEGPIQSFLEKFVTDIGLEVDRFIPDLDVLRQHRGFVETTQSYTGRPNVVGVLKGTGGGRSLLFNGHVDVIPEGAPENWKHGCWSGDIENSKLYGRGAADMKSGVAAMTMALHAIRACNIALKGDVIVEYVMDEELTGNGTLACVLKGYKADAGICCETSSMYVQPGSIGRIWFEIRVKGKAAGIQRRYEGVNAIDLGYCVMKAVSAFEELRIKTISHPLYPEMRDAIPCMVGQFESGSYASAFPDACVMKGSMATVPGENSDAVKNDFVRFVIETVQAEDPWFIEHPPEILFTGYFAEPSEIPAESPIVRLLCESYQDILGVAPVISGRQGAADIRHLNQYGDTPTVIFGPGMTEQMHANNEWVNVDDYIHSIKILAETIINWCDVEK